MKKTTTRKLLAMLLAIVMFAGVLTGCGYDALGEELGVTNDDTQHQHENADTGDTANTVKPEDGDFQAQIDSSINQQLAETMVAVETENEALKLEVEESAKALETANGEKARLQTKVISLERQVSDAEEQISVLEALLEEYKVAEAKQLPWPYSEVEFDANGNPVRIKSMEAAEALVRIDCGNGLFVYRLGEGKKLVITDEINCMTGKYWDNEFDLAHKWGTIVGQTHDGALHYINAAHVKGDRFYSKDLGNGTTAKEGFSLTEMPKDSSLYGDLPMDWSHAIRYYNDESAPGKVAFCFAYTESVYVKPAPKPVHCSECGHKDSCPDSCRCECCYKPDVIEREVCPICKAQNCEGHCGKCKELISKCSCEKEKEYINVPECSICHAKECEGHCGKCKELISKCICEPEIKTEYIKYCGKCDHLLEDCICTDSDHNDLEDIPNPNPNPNPGNNSDHNDLGGNGGSTGSNHNGLEDIPDPNKSSSSHSTSSDSSSNHNSSNSTTSSGHSPLD